jgi:ketosteroid isomerase-like protein
VQQNFAKSPSAKVLKYMPDIRDVQVVDGVAYEWGYFDSTFKPAEGAPPVTFRPRFVRMLRQQADGGWKFVRVTWAAE